MVRERWLVMALLAVGCITSCARDQGPPRDARAEAAATAGQRLQGRWVLASFQPQVPLEPVLQVLLNAQIDHLVVDFKGQSIVAQGPGVTINRTFKIDEAYLDHFKATVSDSYGVGVDVVGDFAGSTMVVSGLDSPWKGRASFRRVM
jgi:hypothetical protein